MSDTVPQPPSTYPVKFDVERQLTDRNRLTTAFRYFLAIPHLVIVGALGSVAEIVGVISWFAILFTGTQPRGLWDFNALYMRWYARTYAYVTLLRDEYPPFGDMPYPVTFEATYPEGPRDRLSVGLRIFYVIPHLIVAGLLGVAWYVTTLVAWFAILFTGEYPEGLYEFGVKVMRYVMRVISYFLLMHDEFPPFGLQP
jgi:hypothetical protein